MLYNEQFYSPVYPLFCLLAVAWLLAMRPKKMNIHSKKEL